MVLAVCAHAAHAQTAPEASPAAAQIEARSEAQPPEAQPPEVQPEDVSGLESPRDDGPSAGLQVGRALLLPLRGIFFVVMAPVRLTYWALDRFAVKARIKQFFFSDDGRFGLYPIGSYKTGFGPGVGGRFVMRNVVGDGSRVRIDGLYGGEVVQAYKVRYRSGMFTDRRLVVDAKAGFETFPRNRFFGIGNRDLTAPPTMPVDPSSAAVDTRFYYDMWSFDTGITGRIGGPVRAKLTGSYRIRSLDLDEVSDGDVNTFDVYDPDRLPGARNGTTSANVDVSLIFDTLDQPKPFISRATPSRGWYAVLHGGYRHGLGAEPSEYVSWGFDIQRHINLYAENRFLVLRALVDGVSGSLSDIPFMDLPRLGGGALLRGYAQDRFRDRRAGLVSAEYQWDLDRELAGFLFADVGRVWRNLDDLDGGELRLGFGVGLQLHSMNSFTGRMMLASTREGGVFLLFSFDPLFEREREK